MGNLVGLRRPAGLVYGRPPGRPSIPPKTGWAGAAEVGASELRGQRSWTKLESSPHVQEVGRMKIELFADVVPKTAENFR